MKAFKEVGASFVSAALVLPLFLLLFFGLLELGKLSWTYLSKVAESTELATRIAQNPVWTSALITPQGGSAFEYPSSCQNPATPTLQQVCRSLGALQVESVDLLVTEELTTINAETRYQPITGTLVGYSFELNLPIRAVAPTQRPQAPGEPVYSCWGDKPADLTQIEMQRRLDIGCPCESDPDDLGKMQNAGTGCSCRAEFEEVDGSCICIVGGAQVVPDPVLGFGTCQCDCPQGQIAREQDQGGRLTCVCDCPTGQVMVDGQCFEPCDAPDAPQDVSACEDNQTYMPSPVCECKPCEAGQIRDPGDHTRCICAPSPNPQECLAEEPPQYFSPECLCESCPSNFEPNDEGTGCDCAIDGAFCASDGKFFMAGSCSCEACPSGRVPDQDGLACICPDDAPTVTDCVDDGLYYDEESCSCQACVAPQVPVDGTGCGCPSGGDSPASCRDQVGEHYFRSSTCSCVECQANYISNSSGSACVCGLNGAACRDQNPSKIFKNPCRCASCPSGEEPNSAGTSCVCEGLPGARDSCESQSDFHVFQTTDCECEIVCGAGDPTTCSGDENVQAPNPSSEPVLCVCDCIAGHTRREIPGASGPICVPNDCDIDLGCHWNGGFIYPE